MVRGRNTKGMVGFSTFLGTVAASGPAVTDAGFVNSCAAICARHSATDRRQVRGMCWIIGRSKCGAFPAAGEFHSLYVRLAGLHGGDGGIKSLRLLRMDNYES